MYSAISRMKYVEIIILYLLLQYFKGLFNREGRMDFQNYQRLIDKQITDYEQTSGKAHNMYKRALNQIEMYEIELLDTVAADERVKWLANQKKRLNKIKEQKMIIKPDVEVQKIKALGDDIEQRLKGIMVNTEQAIQASTYIRIELQRQIEELDQLEDENKQFKKRIKKAKKGLKVIIRRALANKITRFLMILVILAVIGLVVVSILKDNNKI